MKRSIGAITLDASKTLLIIHDSLLSNVFFYGLVCSIKVAGLAEASFGERCSIIHPRTSVYFVMQMQLHDKYFNMSLTETTLTFMTAWASWAHLCLWHGLGNNESFHSDKSLETVNMAMKRRMLFCSFLIMNTHTRTLSHSAAVCLFPSWAYLEFWDVHSCVSTERNPAQAEESFCFFFFFVFFEHEQWCFCIPCVTVHAAFQQYQNRPLMSLASVLHTLCSSWCTKYCFIFNKPSTTLSLNLSSIKSDRCYGDSVSRKEPLFSAEMFRDSALICSLIIWLTDCFWQGAGTTQ